MFNEEVGLVVEGGGMRGAYTAGVLDAFTEHGIEFPYVIGVSAGANNSAGFLAKQIGRSKRIYTKWVLDSRFIGLKNIFKYGTYFGMDFIFSELPDRYETFDYDTYFKTKSIFKVVVSNCKTGRAEYFEPLTTHKHLKINQILRASSSLPLVAKEVILDDVAYLDGGIIDPIPIHKAMEDGFKHNIVILTRNKGYKKKPATSSYLLSKIFIRKYPKFNEAIINRHKVYNNTLEYIEDLESKNEVFVFRPIKPLEVDRFNKDSQKLLDLYQQGYDETIQRLDELSVWLKQKHENEQTT